MAAGRTSGVSDGLQLHRLSQVRRPLGLRLLRREHQSRRADHRLHPRGFAQLQLLPQVWRRHALALTGSECAGAHKDRGEPANDRTRSNRPSPDRPLRRSRQVGRPAEGRKVRQGHVVLSMALNGRPLGLNVEAVAKAQFTCDLAYGDQYRPLRSRCIERSRCRQGLSDPGDRTLDVPSRVFLHCRQNSGATCQTFEPSFT